MGGKPAKAAVMSSNKGFGPLLRHYLFCGNGANWSGGRQRGALMTVTLKGNPNSGDTLYTAEGHKVSASAVSEVAS